MIKREMTNSDYHATPALSSTGVIKLINQTPAHFKAYIDDKPEPTDAMILGTAFHVAVLEPRVFAANYIQKPDGMSFATKEGKSWKLDHESKSILSFDDYNRICLMRDSIKDHAITMALLTEGVAESSYFWTDEKTGVECKCRPDFLSGNTVLDVKTAESASPKKFQRSMVKYGYDIQTAFYLRGMTAVTGERHTDFVHIVVEKSAPYVVACYVLDDDSICMANELIDHALATYAECAKNKFWPAYPEHLMPITYPTWGR